MVAYGNGFYLAMVDVNERVSGNWSRSKVLLHLICYKVWSSVGVEPSLFFDNIVTSMFEQKQELVNELLEPTTHILKHISSREELIKDKVSHLVHLDVL